VSDHQTGPKNPNWKGGRTVDPRGYVLIRVGKDHPLADVRGYAYEHRLIAQEYVDHPLTTQEHIHHDNEQKGDNRPNNLVPTASLAEHFVHHRKDRQPGKALRLPHEDNVQTDCACGCGTTFLRYDKVGRPREYVSGHNPQEAWQQNAIEQAVLLGAESLDAIARMAGVSSRRSLCCLLSRLVKQGKIARRGIGIYGPPGSMPCKRQETISCACGCGMTFEKYDKNWRLRRYVSGHNRIARGT
jgi:hypothetical protein